MIVKVKQKLVVIGGGASGLVAAITAARRGLDVTILEKQNRVGKKILATGNGRCNWTNTNVKKEHFHSRSTKDIFLPIEKFGVEDTIQFFESLGIIPLIEKNKVFPLSEQATSILDVLRLELLKLNVKMEVETKVKEIKKKENIWHIATQNGEQETKIYKASQVIVATGGLAGTKIDHTIYHILKKLGHTIQPMFPTLVHITSSNRLCKMLKGIRVQAETMIYQAGELKRVEKGEILFTEDGLSGPPIFQLSRIAAQSQVKKIPCTVKMDFLPRMSKEDIIGILYERIANYPERTLEDLFVGWLNKRVAQGIIKAADIGTIQSLCENLDYEMIVRLVDTIKAYEFEVTGTRDFKFAQATAGGIAIDEIDLVTMQSTLHQGLYLVGELIDVDGDCGGYNLQWAWSTGIIAGEHAASRKE